ncbi:MAG: DUF3179 domain-containing protein, partial [SAR202 cluster bacterium]|nr:DUF3179 domain-containing protein [SAR202 cluster bacterium]
GAKLKFIPSQILSWGDFRAAYPDGHVLTRPSGLRDYDRPPYASYDLSERPFLFRGEIDPRLGPVERVVALETGGQAVAYPFSLLAEHPVVNDTIGNHDIVIFYAAATLTPFPDRDLFPSGISGSGGEAVREAVEKALAESSPADFLPSRAVGSAAAYDPTVRGQRLTFFVRDGLIVDSQTGSAWDITGRAVSGPLAGERLAPILHGTHFWFAWAAFHPDTLVRTAADVGLP